MNGRRILIGLATLATAGATTLAVTTATSGAEAAVTRGDFVPFAVGADLPISGHAQMVRTADGKTIVTVHIEGLTPGTTYPVHVHSGDCATNATGGSHYFFSTAVPGGAGPASNEIWPGPVSANGGGVADGKATVDATAGATAASVVIHRPTAAPNKIACADLS